MTLLLSLPWALAPAPSQQAKEQQPPHHKDISAMVLSGQRVPDLHGAEGREEVGLFYQQDPSILSGVQGDQEEPEHKARGVWE